MLDLRWLTRRENQNRLLQPWASLWELLLTSSLEYGNYLKFRRKIISSGETLTHSESTTAASSQRIGKVILVVSVLCHHEPG